MAKFKAYYDRKRFRYIHNELSDSELIEYCGGERESLKKTGCFYGDKFNFYIDTSDGVNEDLGINEYCGRILRIIDECQGKPFILFKSAYSPIWSKNIEKIANENYGKVIPFFKWSFNEDFYKYLFPNREKLIEKAQQVIKKHDIGFAATLKEYFYPKPNIANDLVSWKDYEIFKVGSGTDTGFYTIETRKVLYEKLKASKFSSYLQEKIPYKKYLKESFNWRVCLNPPGIGEYTSRMFDQSCLGQCVVLRKTSYDFGYSWKEYIPEVNFNAPNWEHDLQKIVDNYTEWGEKSRLYWEKYWSPFSIVSYLSQKVEEFAGTIKRIYIGNKYSPYKMIAFPDRIDQLKRGEIPPPISAILRITGFCNGGCSFCHLKKVKKDVGKGLAVDTNLLLNFLKDFSKMGGKSVEYTGGEPTMHKDFDKFIKATVENGLSYGVITNGLLLNKFLDLLNTAAWIRVSLNPIFVQKKTHLLKHIRDMQKDSEAVVTTSYIVTHDGRGGIKENLAEMKNVLDTLQENGIYDIRVSPDHFLAKEQKSKIKMYMLDLKENYKDMNITLQNEKFLERSLVENRRCYYADMQLRLDCSGLLLPCSSPVLSITKKYSYGDLNKERFKEIWNTRKCKFNINKDCMNYCIHSTKVKFLEYCVSEKEHVEFI